MPVDERFRPGIKPPESLEGEHFWFVVHDGRVLLSESGGRLPLPQFRRIGLTGLDVGDRHYLGTLDGRHVFAVGLTQAQPAPAGMYFEDMRRLLAADDPLLFGLAGRARQIVDWANDHRYCSRCGQPSAPHAGDRAMVCTACGYAQYPRVSPCVIVLVTRGREVLLARSPRFPRGIRPA